MSDSQVFWLNVTNAVLGILVLLPVVALLIAVIAESGKSARRRILFYFRLHEGFHRSTHLGAHR